MSTASAQTARLSPLEDWERPRSSRLALAFVIGSVLVHGLGFWALDAWVKVKPPAKQQKPVELVMFEVPKPPPPKVEEEKKPEPPPPPKVKAKPPPIKVAESKPLPPPPDAAPPPPNDAPPPTPSKPVPLVVGISMSSTTTSGSFAAPVGNTVYGKTANKAVAPSEVKAYSAPKYTPVYQVDSEPSVASEFKPDYPPEARKAGIEGQVLLSITVDDQGQVVDAKVLKGMGYGCDEAALKGIKRYRFKPAIKGGEAVSTTINYTVTFLLD